MLNNNQLNVKLAISFKVCSDNNIEDLSIPSIISFVLKHYNTHKYLYTIVVNSLCSVYD